jgi:hypothetical protein
MPTNHIIDYNAITDYIAEENRRDLRRTWSPYDMLLHNINNVLTNLLNGWEEDARTIAITLDHDQKKVTVFGDPIPDPKPDTSLDTLAYMCDKPPQEQLYHLFDDLVDFAKRNDQYDRFFKAIYTET